MTTREMLSSNTASGIAATPVRKHKIVARGLLVAAMAGGLAFGMAMPAFADGPTATTFTMAAGTLAVAVQPTAGLTGALTGVTSITGNLGNVTVTDGRGGVVAWNLTAGSSTFLSTPVDVPSTSTDVTYATGTVVVTGQVTAPAFSAASIMTPAVVIASAAVSGNNTASFDPTLVVTLPSRALAGAYAGTVTTSVL